MTRSNRIAARVVLAVLGLVAIAVGGALGLVTLRAAGARIPGPYGATLDAVDPADTVRGLDRAVTTGPLWTVVAVCAALVVVALVVIATRGGGGTSVAVRDRDVDGQVTVNVALLRDVVDHELGALPDVVRTRVDTYRVRRSPAARIRVTVRRGADAVDVLAATDRAVRTLDAVLGRELPVLVHLVGSARTTPARRAEVR